MLNMTKNLTDNRQLRSEYRLLPLTKNPTYDQNNLMLKKFSAAAITTGSMLILATTAYAQNTGTLSPPPGSINPNIDPVGIPQLLVNLLFVVATFLAIAYLMYGGIKWITSRGDKMQVEAARKHIVASIIGLVIVAGSFFILQVVFRILGADNPLSGGFKLPTISPNP